MLDPVRELKTRAEILHARIGAGEPSAIARLRALPELARAGAPALAAMAQDARRKHCLAVVARECGFTGWEHARRVLDGDAGERDFGKLLDGGAASAGVLSPWFSSYDEAKTLQLAEHGEDRRRYLLAYTRQFFVASSAFVETLGLDPDDPDWHAIGWDWVRPQSLEARRRLYSKRIAALRGRP